jgi:hypothetical protein
MQNNLYEGLTRRYPQKKGLTRRVYVACGNLKSITFPAWEK